MDVDVDVDGKRRDEDEDEYECARVWLSGGSRVGKAERESSTPAVQGHLGAPI